MPEFKCAWETKIGWDQHRCKAQCESCRKWWPDEPERDAVTPQIAEDEAAVWLGHEH